MTAALFALVLTLASTERASDHVTIPRGIDAIEAVVVVVAEGEPLPIGRAATARLLLAWSWYESRWNACALGDQGRSVGVMQVNRAWLGADADRVVCDAREGYRAGLRVLRHLVGACGPMRSALAAYAGGRCQGSPKVNALVERRCAAAGAACGGA